MLLNPRQTITASVSAASGLSFSCFTTYQDHNLSNNSYSNGNQQAIVSDTNPFLVASAPKLDYTRSIVSIFIHNSSLDISTATVLFNDASNNTSQVLFSTPLNPQQTLAFLATTGWQLEPPNTSTSSGSIAGSIAVSNFPSSFIVNQGTDPWIISGNVSVSGITFPSSMNVDVTNFPAGFNVNNFPSGFNVNNWPSFPWQVYWSGAQAVSGTVSVIQSTNPWLVNVQNTTAVSGNVGINNWPAYLPVSQYGAWTVNVSGTVPVSVSNFPSTQGVSGSVSVSNFPSGFNVNNWPSFPWQVYWLGAMGVSGTVSVGNFPSGFNVNNFPSLQQVYWVGAQAISGTVYQGNAPWTQNLIQLNGTTVSVSGGNQDNGTLRVVIAKDQQPIPVTLSGTQTLQVSGTVNVQNILSTTISGTVVTTLKQTSTHDQDWGVLFSHVSKASSGYVTSIRAWNFSPTTPYYIQLFNSAVLPATGTTPFRQYPIGIGASVAATELDEELEEGGECYTTGITWAKSTTSGTYTQGTVSDLFIDIGFN